MKGFFLFFLGLDYIFNTSLKLNTKTSLNIIGLIHHIPALYGSYKILGNSLFWEEKMYYITDWSHLCMMWSAAFFCFDVVYHIKYYWPLKIMKKVDFMIHAIACCITYMYIYESRKYHWFGAVFLTWESSTPFLYISWWLYNNNMKHFLIYKINSLLFVMTYISSRIIFGSYVFWFMVYPNVNLFLRFVGITLNTLNYLWFYKIIKRLCN
jgi:hypothetical protein